MAPEVQHDEPHKRFVIALDGGPAFLSYAFATDRTLDLRSTFVPITSRERGVGERLVVHALEYARDRGYRVIPTCWFVARVLERHPEYRAIALSPDG
jgi:uncharacterized protein